MPGLHAVIHRYHSLRHFSAHLDPIWEALPAGMRGATYSRDFLPPPIKRDHSRPFLVASYVDAQAVAPNPYVWCDHGSGQSYIGVTNGSYSGGEGHDRCVLFLCPSERVAMRWRERYDVPAVAIGCPRLDRYRVTHGGASGNGNPVGSQPTSQVRVLHTSPTVAVSFHWACSLVPETMSAWRYYDPHLPRLVRDPRFRVVGHGHPRLWPTIRRRWAELGVDEWPDVDRVLSEADLLVVDNSSVGFEMAAIGKPVVLLNLPSYRREVEHGGRFWTSPPGIQVDHPSELADAIVCALADPPAHQAIRARAVAWSYDDLNDGHASERAATAILEVLSGQ